ncbi:MAG TPA: NAD(P)/FAD-dependent oxidoreductase [Gemmatimonadales bacterium]|nr:NAD(P)/FAD-dependent oxidoreductase [Gemmatimonadales bacterium]
MTRTPSPATLVAGIVDSRPRVVIVGGGFAGLYTAKNLKRSGAQVTVIDRRNHHLFQPMLYQVATAALDPSDIANPIRSILRRQKNTEVLLGDVVSVDVETREVLLSDGVSLPYDYLIVATGARHSYFGRDDWEPIAPGLKSLEDAITIRNRVLLAFEEAEREIRPERRHAFLTFVVVGGGPTGVELAGALAEIRNYALQRDFRQINPRDATVMLIEAGPRILPTYPPALSDSAVNALRRLGVEVRVNTMVTDVREWSVQAGEWSIPTHTVLWAAGNVASPLLKTLRTPLDRQGRAIVGPDCTIPGHPEVFVLGDAAHFARGEGTLPGVSPVAIQMGQYVARLLREEIAGRADSSRRPPFRYWDKGQLAVIGRGRAVADIGRLHFGGLFAWLAWIFVHIFFLIGFRNRLLVLIQWAYSYVTYRRGARIISGEIGPVSPTKPVREFPTRPPDAMTSPPGSAARTTVP